MQVFKTNGDVIAIYLKLPPKSKKSEYKIRIIPKDSMSVFKMPLSMSNMHKCKFRFCNLNFYFYFYEDRVKFLGDIDEYNKNIFDNNNN